MSKDFEKEYIVKTLGNFTLLAGEALYNDTSLELNADQAVFITQIIAVIFKEKRLILSVYI